MARHARGLERHRRAGRWRLAHRLATYDLVRLEKINPVRSRVLVYFERLLRDA